MNPLDIHRIYSRLRQHRASEIGPSEARSWASVALVLRPNSHAVGGLDLLFIRRARKEGDPWSGHMAFPGGRREPGDPELLDTARRETFEEVGLDLIEHGELLAALDDVKSPVKDEGRGLAIRPFVFLCPAPPELKPNHEVERCYWFALEELKDPSSRGTFPYEWKKQQIRLPVVRIEDADIWGISLRMLDGFFRVSGGVG